MISIFKIALKSALSKFGYVIAQEHRLPSSQTLFMCLSKKNIAPQLIIDIGVAYGTDWLYNTYPKAKYILIDPTKESLPYMNSWAKQLDASIMNFALGDINSKRKIYVRP